MTRSASGSPTTTGLDECDPHPPGTVLVGADHPHRRRSRRSAACWAEILDAAGHHTDLARNGHEGLEALRNHPTDLVVCDINMPGLDGFGVLKAVRADPQLATLPFVFLTSEADVRAGIVSGADDYLMKPVSAADLLAAIDARLARHEITRKEADRRWARCGGRWPRSSPTSCARRSRRSWDPRASSRSSTATSGPRRSRRWRAGSSRRPSGCTG